MAALRTAKTVLAVEKDTSDGSGATLVAADAIKITDVTINQVSDAVDKSAIDGKFGAKPFIQSNTRYEASFSVEAIASGTAGDPPAYSDLLEACGLAMDDGASTVVYTPETNLETAETATIGIYIDDGLFFKMIKSRGSFTLNVTSGSVPTYNFTFIGQYVGPTATTNLSPTYSTENPLIANSTNTTPFTIHSHSGALQSFTFEQNNNLYYSELVGGSKQVRITERDSGGSCVFESVAIGTKNFHSIVDSQATGNLTWTHGQTSGSKIVFLASYTQLETIGQEDSEGYQMFNVGYRALPSSGNDEFTLTYQ